MAQEIKAEKFQTTVIFDASKIGTSDPFTFAGDGVSPDGEDFTISVQTPLAMISLEAKTVNGDSTAVFTTSSIQWLDPEGFPITTPTALFVQRTTPLHVTLLSVNRAKVANEQFNMEVSVVYKGRTYTSPDPTIINVAEPPGHDIAVGKTDDFRGLDIRREPVMSAQIA